ncbi:MAG: porphobilinogen synthase [Verrucomicrobiota bacterium]
MAVPESSYLMSRRPRRLRKNAAVRSMIRENRVAADDLVLPLFVIEGQGLQEAIPSMPGQFRRCVERTVKFCRDLADLGLKGVALFPKIDSALKDEQGTEALNEGTLVLRAVRAIKEAIPELQIFTDVALDPYTSHGHDGVLTPEKDDVANDETVSILSKMAILHAAAGVDFVAPSDMMDGRVGAIRVSLDEAGFQSTGIMSYTAKYASAFYGPFRDAVGSAQAAGTHLLSKKTYQMDPANRREAQIELALDEEEGADMVMVKPAGAYLDIIREIRDASDLPITAYQVSGEYSQIHAAAERGWLDLKECRDESLLAIKRAGADLIFSYFTEDILRGA